MPLCFTFIYLKSSSFSQFVLQPDLNETSLIDYLLLNTWTVTLTVAESLDFGLRRSEEEGDFSELLWPCLIWLSESAKWSHYRNVFVVLILFFSSSSCCENALYLSTFPFLSGREELIKMPFVSHFLKHASIVCLLLTFLKIMTSLGWI